MSANVVWADESVATKPEGQIDPEYSVDVENNNSNIGNKLSKSDYPDAKNIAPFVEDIQKAEDTKVIEGSIEKTIDLTLEECIKYALGNNPRIREAIEDISASDARIKQAWSSYFPNLSWTTNGSKNRNRW